MSKLSDELDLINSFRRIAPVPVETLAKSLGLKVTPHVLPENISGMLEPVPGGGFRIIVNAFHPATRQRFTIAHELGHYILHRHLIGTGLGDDRAYRSADTGRYRNMAIGPQQETEANRFAASLLMPTELVKQLQEEGINDPSVIARRLGVSPQAYHIRMGIPYTEAFI